MAEELIRITVVPEKDLGTHIEVINQEMRAYTDQAARGECAWICSDCCCSDPKGMPDACFHGHAKCTEIIQRDKQFAMREGTKPV